MSFVFLCVFFLDRVNFVFFVRLVFVLSVPVQVIAWKDSSPK